MHRHFLVRTVQKRICDMRMNTRVSDFGERKYRHVPVTAGKKTRF